MNFKYIFRITPTGGCVGNNDCLVSNDCNTGLVDAIYSSLIFRITPTGGWVVNNDFVVSNDYNTGLVDAIYSTVVQTCTNGTCNWQISQPRQLNCLHIHINSWNMSILSSANTPYSHTHTITGFTVQQLAPTITPICKLSPHFTRETVAPCRDSHLNGSETRPNIIFGCTLQIPISHSYKLVYRLANEREK